MAQQTGVQSVSQPSGTGPYIVTFSNGVASFVPQDPLNADYQRVQAWVTAGGTITNS